jgi:hypothetical protein
VANTRDSRAEGGDSQIQGQYGLYSETVSKKKEREKKGREGERKGGRAHLVLSKRYRK